jgi:hypothetical protein
LVHDLEIRLKKLVVGFRKEVGVFKVSQKKYIEYCGKGDDPLPCTVFGLLKDPLSKSVIDNDGKSQQKHEQAGCFVIQEQTDYRNEDTAHQLVFMQHREEHHDKYEEQPKIQAIKGH